MPAMNASCRKCICAFDSMYIYLFYAGGRKFWLVFTLIEIVRYSLPCSMINTGSKNRHGPPQNLASIRSLAFAILGSFSSYRSAGSLLYSSFSTSAAAGKVVVPVAALDMSVNVTCHLKVIATTPISKISNRDSCIRPRTSMSSCSELSEWKKKKA